MKKDTTQIYKIGAYCRQTAFLGNILVYLLLTIWALVVLFPFYWMLLTSVKLQFLQHQSTFPPSLH